MKRLEFDPASIESAWAVFEESVGGAIPIRSPRQYARATQLLDELLDIVGGMEQHPLAGLLEVVGDLVGIYEASEVAMPDAHPRDVLRLLMEANGLSQSDLANELGGQPVVSDVLSGKREINARQARALAKRFGVSAAAFIGIE